MQQNAPPPALAPAMIIGLGALFLAAFLLQLGKTLYIGGTDDAFITYTFARNLAEGHGIAWYPGGPPVYGSTTLLYTFLLAAAGKLGFAIPVASTVIAALAWSGAGTLLALLLTSLAGPVTGVAAAALAAISFLHVVTTAGMETGLYTFIALLAFWLYLRDRLVAAALVAAAALLTRPDGVIVIGLIGLHFGLTHWPLRWAVFLRGMRLAVPFGLCLIVYVVANRWYFGTVLPNSFHAKATFGSEISGLFSIRAYLANQSGFGSDFLAETLREPYRGIVLAELLLGALFVLWRWRDRATVFFFFGALNLAIYDLTRMPDSVWYYAPSYFAGYGLMLLGLHALGRSAAWVAGRLGQAQWQPLARAIGLPAYCLSLFAVGVMCGRAITVDTWGLWSNARYSKHPQNDLKYVTDVFIDILRERGQTTPSVMAYEVGLLSFLTRSRIHDLLGLVSPDVVMHGGVRNPLYVLQRYRPDYAIITDSQAYPPLAPILQSRDFIGGYQQLFIKPRVVGDNYLILERRPRRLEEVWRPSAVEAATFLSADMRGQRTERGYEVRPEGNDPFAVYTMPQPTRLKDGVVCFEMTSVVPALAELRWNTTAGYTPQRLHKLLVARGRQELCAVLPPETELTDFRIDPIDQAMPVTLHQLVVLERRDMPSTTATPVTP